MLRSLFRCLLRLHPPRFRDRFEAEMLLVFDDVTLSGTGLWLTADAAISLFRQWVLRDNHWSPAAKGQPLNQLASAAPLFTSIEERRFRPGALVLGGVLSVTLFAGIVYFVGYGREISADGNAIVWRGGRSAGLLSAAPLVPAELFAESAKITRIAETPAARRLLEWVQIYNTGDLRLMHAFYGATHTPRAEDDAIEVEHEARQWSRNFQLSGQITLRTLTQYGLYRATTTARDAKGKYWTVRLDLDEHASQFTNGVEMRQLSGN